MLRFDGLSKPLSPTDQETLPGDAQAARVVQAAVNLAHDLGMKAVAESIETIEACGFLRSIGCDIGQGFLISRPMPKEALVNWLKMRAVGTHVV
ncbi:MAG: EAL domain-containing protein [Gammaproteobacteria bacterium]|nr:EAL domain-containing protein [Gammaproteobacteria bacterium]MCP5459436.1 EAL domain-containing protein [Gammaproteobacteria bacterium]